MQKTCDMANIRIHLDTRASKENAPLTLAISHKTKTALLPLGPRLAANQWDKKGQKVINHPRKQQLNLFLQDKLFEAQKTLFSIKNINSLTAIDIRDRISGKGEAGRFYKRYLKYIDDCRTEGNKFVYRLTLSCMEKFDPCLKERSFEDIDKDWLTRFDSFLAKTQKTNTRSMRIRCIRAVFNAAIDDEITDCYPFRRFKIHQEETRKRSLTLDQLRELRDMPCEPYQKEYVDMFMLMFYLSGINAADLFQAKRSDIENGRLEYRRQKTHRLYSVKVEPEAQEIIDRYKGRTYLLNILERYNNYKDYLHHMNDALKAVGRPLGKRGKIEGEGRFKDLSSYWSRHTVATLAAEIGIPIDTISIMLGHSFGHSTTRIYIREDVSKADRAMRQLIDYIK